MRITATWLRLDGRQRWRSLAVLALLIALATATILTSIAGARRGESAYNRLWARTLPATATVLPNQPGFNWARIAALPEVSALTKFPVAFGFEVQGYTAASSGFPLADDQMTRTIERPVILAGRLFNPHRVDEVVITPKFAATSGKHVGDTLTLELSSVQQANEGYDGSTGPPRGPKIRARIEGVIRSPWDLDADTPGSPGGVLSTPALFTRYRADILGSTGQTFINALVRLNGGEAAIPEFRRDLERVTGRSDIDVWDNSVNFGDPIRRVTAYEAACLLAFGLAALVAAMFLIGQSVARYTSATVADLQVLQAVGMSRRQAIAAASAGPFLAGVAGGTLGVAAAIVASRWMPIGLASIAEPHPGIDVDWVVLGLGWVIVPLLVLAGSATAAAAALTTGRRQAPARRSAIAAAAAGASFPVPLVVGTRFAFESGQGRSTVPVRSALLGAVIGVLGVLAAFTFAAGVSDAASHPARFGQTWQLTTFLGYNGQDFGPASRVLRAVAADRDVTGVDDARIGGAQSGQVSVESFTYDPVGGRRPSVVLTAGRMPSSQDEIVLAPTTAQELHAGTGSVVRLTGGTTTAKAVRVTGIGFVPPGPHNGYADGAWLTPAGFNRIFHGAHYAFKFHTATVALRPGADVRAVARRLDAVAAAISGGKSFTFTPPTPLSEIQEIKDLELLPLALSAFLALLAVSAVGHTLSTAVRRRRHDLAVLRALGMTPRQARLVITTQASLLAVVGLLFGVPLGIALGRVIWRTVAGFTPLAYHPPLALLALLLVAPVALLAANALAAWPQRRAARLHAGQVLRSE
ncbi:MAG: FtsX-like permease family protein [Streptosporangiaceae bacterium]